MNVPTAGKGRVPLAALAAAACFAIATLLRPDVAAQFGQQPPPPYQPPPAPRAAAPIDLTGYWASAITEDWQWRMITPSKGDFIAVPLNADGDKIGKGWDPDVDVASHNECKPFGAAGILRLPTRLHIQWEDDKTLRMEMDLGTQTRLVTFDRTQPAGDRSWQGHAVAEWIDVPPPVPPRGGGARGGRGGAAAQGNTAGAAPDPAAATGASAGAPAPARDQSGAGQRGASGGQGRGDQGRVGGLKIVTTNLREQYLRRNGVPVSENAIVTDYLDTVPSPTGDQWLIIKTIVEDPRYLTQPYTTSSQFKKEPDGSKWNPTPCEVVPPAK